MDHLEETTSALEEETTSLAEQVEPPRDVEQLNASTSEPQTGGCPLRKIFTDWNPGYKGGIGPEDSALTREAILQDSDLVVGQPVPIFEISYCNATLPQTPFILEEDLAATPVL